MPPTDGDLPRAREQPGGDRPLLGSPGPYGTKEAPYRGVPGLISSLGPGTCSSPGDSERGGVRRILLGDERARDWAIRGSVPVEV
jgi:hypothetical protein